MQTQLNARTKTMVDLRKDDISKWKKITENYSNQYEKKRIANIIDNYCSPGLYSKRIVVSVELKVYFYSRGVAILMSSEKALIIDLRALDKLSREYIHIYSFRSNEVVNKEVWVMKLKDKISFK